MHLCHVCFKPELWMTLEDIQRVHIRSRTQFYCCPCALWNAVLPQSLNNRMQSDLRSSKFPFLSSPSPVFIHGSLQSTGLCWKAYLLLPEVLVCLWGFWGCKCLFSAWRVFLLNTFFILHITADMIYCFFLPPLSSHSNDTMFQDITVRCILAVWEYSDVFYRHYYWWLKE